MTFALLRSQRFLPLFLTQAFGAINDNLIKNAMVVLILFAAMAGGPQLVALSGGLFILPYALFSATAGQLADRFDKSRLIRLTKLVEVALMGLAALGFLLNSLPILMAVLFGLGVQATFFGPLKYGILPDHLTEHEIVAGNALIEAGTFAGILIGTIGGALILADHGAIVVSSALLVLAAAGAVAAFRVPRAPAASPDLVLAWNVVKETASLLRQAKANRPVWLSILGLSWFWCFGAILLAEFPVIAAQTLGADSHVVTLLLTVFAVGVGGGSILAGRMLKGEISARHVPFAALGLSIFAFDFALACGSAGTDLVSVHAVLVHPAGWRILGDLVVLAMCGGIYSVPLYAILQERSDPTHRARMIASNNVMNAAFMASGAVATAGLAYLMSPQAIVAVAAVVNLAVTAVIVRLLPQETMRAALRWYFKVFHRAEIKGIENYTAAGPRRVIVVNHLSFLDGCFVAAHLPGEVTFAVNTLIARHWWAKVLLAFVRVFLVDPGNPYALKAMIKAVREGTTLAIFPEGRLTRTGALMKVYEGAGAVADKGDAELIPVRIDGLQFTHVSYMGGKLRLRWFPKLTLEVLPARRLAVDPALRGRNRRQAIGTALQNLMIDTAFGASPIDRTLFGALLDARGRYGAGLPIAEDMERKPITYQRLILGAAVLGRRLIRGTEPGERVGVLLPNANAAAVTFFGLLAFARVPTPLNVSTGSEGMAAICRSVGLRHVVSSRTFIARGKLDAVAARLGELVEITYLEDIRPTLGLREKLRGWLDARFARRLPGCRVDPGAAAVVLSTSGSEGAPKAVLLSHRNILANIAQLAAVIDFGPADRVMNAMPIFHSFGLTGGMLLPLLAGVRTFFYPSPLHYRIVPELIYDTDATVVFGTDTFLAGWARFAHPYDFYACRHIFAGAERLKDETRRLYMDRFGIRVLEGYGATETAPALAINTPMASRPGSVGRMLPGISWRLDPVPGIEEGGRLVVRGPNVMLGYMRQTAPGVLEPPEDGWYDTGDIVKVDGEGYVHILGRAKRFAKIAGEMVSLAAAEALAGALWPAEMHAVVTVPDARKGEALVLVTTRADAEVGALVAFARERGTPEIMVPRRICAVEKVPLTGTGKTDYPAVERLARAAAEGRDAA